MIMTKSTARHPRAVIGLTLVAALAVTPFATGPALAAKMPVRTYERTPDGIFYGGINSQPVVASFRLPMNKTCKSFRVDMYVEVNDSYEGTETQLTLKRGSKTIGTKTTVAGDEANPKFVVLKAKGVAGKAMTVEATNLGPLNASGEATTRMVDLYFSARCKKNPSTANNYWTEASS